jgi:hypothetical protein
VTQPERIPVLLLVTKEEKSAQKESLKQEQLFIKHGLP